MCMSCLSIRVGCKLGSSPNASASSAMDRVKSLNIAAVIDAHPLPNATFTPSYGTAGFRAKADLLRSTVFRCGLLTAARALTLRQHCGIMVTASHNAEHDNGVKIVEPTGEMLVKAWEEHATALACATSTTAVLALLQQLLCASQLPTRQAEAAAAGATEVATGAERAAGGGAAAAAGAAASEAGSAAAVGSPSQVAVVVGWDTRPSAPHLVAAARAGVEALGVAVIPLGQVTTPQLHFQLAMLNQGRLLWPPPTPCVPAPQPTPQPAASQQRASHAQPAAAAAADASACPAGDAATPSAAAVGEKASGGSEGGAPGAPCCSVLSLDLYFHTLTNAFHQLLAQAAPCSPTPTPALAAPCSPTPAAAPSSGTVGQGGGASSSSAAAPLYVDCANGVGAEQLRRAARLLRPPPPHPAPSLGPSPPTACAVPPPGLDLVLVNEGGAAGGRLNHECGADYVQKERCAPAGFEGLGQEARCCSIDGDGDRLVYFQLLEGPGGQEGGRGGEQAAPRPVALLDGDKISALAGLLVGELVAGLPPPHCTTTRVGVVQTAYANGASTRFLTHALGLEVACTKTGVKHLHHAALAFDIGIYFEANGHGTLLFSPALILTLTQLSACCPAARQLLLLSQAVNQYVGDALSCILLVEVALRRKGWGLGEWQAVYTDLPSRQSKLAVKDRSVISTTDAERRCLTPPGLQQALDQLVAAAGGRARAFVRPSGTEDIVRVYAEAESQLAADELAAAICQAVYDLAGGVGPRP
ncbi:hypothetical protein V8C86DRAFT_1705972 [Haematococcus lacustris]